MHTDSGIRRPIQSGMKQRGSFGTIFVLFLTLLLTGCIEDKVEPILVGSIQGLVITKALAEPIQDVEITTAPVTSVVYTDANGSFLINNVPEGEYTVIARVEGYTHEAVKVNVIQNKITEVTIKLSTGSLLAPPPELPVPASGSDRQALALTLKWAITNTSDDSLEFAVRIYESNEVTPVISVEGLRDTIYAVGGLKYNTTYYWQVDVKSSTNYITAGELWTFKTIPFPDNHIVFTLRREGTYDLYSSNLAGDSLTRITYSNGYKFRPMFNHNRNLVAFSSNGQIDYHIYLMNSDGSEVRQITNLPIAGFHNQGIGFSWSPDNGKFIYSNYDKLYRIDKDGVNLTHVATAPEGRNFRACDWTVIGNKIVVETVGSAVYDSEIYLMNADGSDSVRLVDNLPGIIESPSFSIDAKEILFTRDVSGFESEEGRQLNAHILILNLDTQTTSDVSISKPAGTNDLQPRFSPDGAKIIFVNAANDGSGSKSIWIMDRNGTNRQKLFDNAEMPYWQ